MPSEENAPIGAFSRSDAAELLATMEKQKGGRPDKTGDSVSPVSETKLSDIGVTKKQSSRWQREAALPEAEFVPRLASPCCPLRCPVADRHDEPNDETGRV